MRNTKIMLVSTDDKRIKHLFHELEPVYTLDIAESIEDGLALADPQSHLAVVVDLNDFGIPDFELLSDLTAEAGVENVVVCIACEHSSQLAVADLPNGLDVIHPSKLLRFVNDLSDATPALQVLEA